MKQPSELVCAERMYSIQNGADPIEYDDYDVDEVAHRYGVTRDAVYRGVRGGSPLYPKAIKVGPGPRGWLSISGEELARCDARRIEFYKTTPSWLKLDGLEWLKPPKRVAARVLLKGTL